MDDLIAFLNARLDEDEASAKAAMVVNGIGGGGAIWSVALVGGVDGEADGDRPVYYQAGGIPTAGQDQHIARHDPDRELREVAAKRAIVGGEDDGLALYVVHERGAWPDELTSAAEQILRHMAAVYSDHPDYRAEWATGSSASS